jgi:hypothetical protein
VLSAIILLPADPSLHLQKLWWEPILFRQFCMLQSLSIAALASPAPTGNFQPQQSGPSAILSGRNSYKIGIMNSAIRLLALLATLTLCASAADISGAWKLRATGGVIHKTIGYATFEFKTDGAVSQVPRT